jgi:AAA ATPase domain
MSAMASSAISAGPKAGKRIPSLPFAAALAVVVALEEPVRGEKLQVRLAVATGTDEVTRRQIEGLFNCRDLGERVLKGFREPIQAWRVLEERVVDDRFAMRHAGRLVPLVAVLLRRSRQFHRSRTMTTLSGSAISCSRAARFSVSPIAVCDREVELAQLLGCWRLAKQAKGQVVWLGGEAGIGKSRIIVELLSRLRAEPHATLRYFCSPYYQASPLYPVISRLEYDARFVRGDTATQKFTKLEHLLRQTGTSHEDGALIADLLGVPVRAPYPALDLSPQARKQRTHDALLRRVAALARRMPLLMLAEDVHWADPSSRELLDRVIALLPDLPILLIVSFRPEFSAPAGGDENATHIELTRLDRHASERLAKGATSGRILAPALMDRIILQSDGVRCLLKSWRDQRWRRR